MNILGYLQKLGKALMLPIAVLPVADLLLRLGQGDLLGIPFMAEAGGVEPFFVCMEHTDADAEETLVRFEEGIVKAKG